MTNNLNGTPLLLKIISLRQHLWTVSIIMTALCTIFSVRDSEIRIVFSIGLIDFLIPEPQKAKLCFLFIVFVCVISLSTLPPLSTPDMISDITW